MYTYSSVIGATNVNIFGLVLLIVIMVAHGHRLRRDDEEMLYLLKMMVATAVGCIVNLIIYHLDGVPGLFTKYILLVGTTYIYLLYVLNGLWWFKFFQHHLKYTEKRWGIYFQILAVVEIIFLILDIKGDYIFIIDSQNRFYRGPYYFIYFIIMITIMLATICMYFLARRKMKFRFFPVILYVLPVLVAEVLQQQDERLAIIIPSMAISLTGIMSGLSNEKIYRDPLTGIFNRTYLNYLESNAKKQKETEVFGVMLDLNGFKKINDTFGHDTGDDALINTAKILSDVVGYKGSAIRYAGDEFVLVIVTNDEKTIEDIQNEITNEFEIFNRNSGKPYQLSAAMGVMKIDIKQQSIKDSIYELDKRMYENKQLYYMEKYHDRRKANTKS